MRAKPSCTASSRRMVVILAALSSCLQGSRPPEAQTHGTLGFASGEHAGKGESAPLSVVFASPQGETTDAAEVSLLFSRPMRSLDLAGEEQKSPVTISPEVPGEWHWVGTTVLVFRPQTHLPRSTEFKVTVPAGTRALDGSAFENPYEFQFTTPLVAVAQIAPPVDAKTLTPDTKFTVHWNQPVTDDEMLRHIRLVADGASQGAKSTTIPFSVRRPDADNAMIAELVPKARLPVNRGIRLSIEAGLHGSEGARPTQVAHAMSFRTYGPFEVEELDCNHDTPHGGCMSGSYMQIKLSNLAKIQDLRDALVIDPPLQMHWSTLGADDAGQIFALETTFPPSKSFSIRLRRSFPSTSRGGTNILRDGYGQALARDWSTRVDIDDLPSKAFFNVRGTYLEANEVRDVSLVSTNVKEMQLATLALKPDDVFELWDLTGRHEGTPFDRLVRQGGRARTVRSTAALNAPFRQLITGDDVLGAGIRGPVGIAYTHEVRGADETRTVASDSRIVQVTDLGISAKVSYEGTTVWVTRLSTGESVAGAQVEARTGPGPGATSGVFVTNGDGLVTIPGDKFAPHPRNETGTIFARSGNDWAYRHVQDELYVYRYGAYVDQRPDEDPIGLVFTERGIYRPKDMVRVKGIVRQPVARGMTTPAGAPVKLIVSGPEGESIDELEGKMTEFGTFSFDVAVPAGAKLGSYSLKAEFPGALSGDLQEDPSLAGSFEVAEYRPAEFKVTAEPVMPKTAVAGRSAYVHGDTAKWNVAGVFLFGAPMSRSDVRYTVTRSPSWFSPELPEGFTSSDRAFSEDRHESSPRASQLLSTNGQLDVKGNIEVAVALSQPGQTEPESVTCEAEVTDVSRQAFSGSSTVLVHPADFYVGLRSGVDYFAKPSDVVRPEVLVVEPEGAKRTQVKVHIDLVHRNYDVARQVGSNSFHNVVTVVDKVVDQCDVVSDKSAVSCALRPSGGGTYLLHATAHDARDNVAAASTRFYVVGEGDVSFGDSDDQRLELVSDKTTYEPGQTAHVLVKSPFKSAEALITVERRGVYSQRRMTITGPMPTIDVPVTEDLRPNAFVSVLLVRGRSQPAPSSALEADVGAPTFRVGYQAITINPESKRLKVALTADKKSYLPGAEVGVDVDVRDSQGKGAKSEVTLYAVDEGVLSLIGYKTPDPLAIFAAPRALRVISLESRQDLAPFRKSGEGNALLASLDKGLEGGGGGGETIRRDFRQSVYFNPALVTNSGGHAHASFKLPDSLTTYRIMAIATSNSDRFGSTDTSVVASRPLMARPAFPRVLRAGDTIDAGIVLTSKGLAASKVTVEASAVGIALTGLKSQTIDLAANASTEVRFAFRADTIGDATVNFRAKTAGAEDSVEIKRPVKSPGALQAVALYGDTTKAIGEKLGDLASMRDDAGGLSLSVSSTALVGLGGGIEHLMTYPYGCTEQLSSQLVPLLSLRSLAQDFKLPLPGDINAAVADTVGVILARQRDDGGFGLFADSPHSLPWVSVYALRALGEAARRGTEVPKDALDRATQYVRATFDDWDRSEFGAPTAAFALDVLADAGTPDVAAMNRLFEQRSQLPLFAEAFLLHAMVTGKGEAQAIAELVRDLEGHVRIDGPVARAVANTGDKYAALMDSDLRTSSLVLRALLAAQPGHPLGSKFAMGILGDREGGTWRTTQETAWALIALDDYRHVQEREVPSFDAHAFLGNTEILSASFQGRNAESIAADLPASRVAASGGQTLTFVKKGEGRLFYEARLRYIPKELPTKTLDRGFFVQKSMRAVLPQDLAKMPTTPPTSGPPPGTTLTFNGGDLVLVDLVVVTPSPRQFVVVDDPLPAGLEAVDTTLTTTAASLNVETQGEDPDPDSRRDRLAHDEEYLSSDSRREVHDDRVLYFVEHMAAGMYHYRYLARATTFGTFSLPVTKAEEMYAPEVFGRTGASVTVIKEASK